MAYVLSRGKTFKSLVNIREPVDGDKVSKSALTVTYERRPRSEFDAVLAEQARLTAEGEPANGRVAWLRLILVNVEGMVDEQGQAVAFDADAKDVLLEDPCAVNALYDHFWQMVNEGKAKLGN
ncbi:MAG: hypothetical protein J0H82_30190 [Alphaproteobacteria bacterium]|nr:hypothetical protein [Alphaproteobacteria bacterium]